MATDDPKDFTPASGDGQQLLEALMTAAVDAIIVMESNGEILLFSRGAEQLFGYGKEDVIGQRIEMLMPDPDRSRHQSYVSNYETTGQRRIIGIGREVKVLDRDGIQIPVDLAVGTARLKDRQVYVGIIRDLRQRNYLETLIRQERERAAALMSLVDILIVGVDRHGQIQLMNRKGTEMLGCDAVPVGQRWLDRIPPEDHERYENIQRTAFDSKTEHVGASEYRIIDAEGIPRYLSWQHRRVAGDESGPEVLLCTGVDITETHRMSQLLREREENLRLTFDQAPVGILRLSLDGKIVELNRALCEMLDISAERLVDQPFDRLVDSDQRRQLREGFRQLIDEQADSVSQNITLRLDPVTIRARLSAGLIRSASGEPLNLLAQIEDRTAQVAAENEIDTLRGRLAHVQRLSVMGEMAAGIAHEINQPLGAIATYADGSLRMIRADPPRMEDVVYGLEQISQQSRRAGEVVRRMRAMARNQEVARHPTDLNQLVTGLMSLARLEARNLNAPLHLDLADNLPKVAADTVQIQQVVLNLIRNSLEALATRSQADHGVTISTRRANEGMVELCVADRGVGIPEEAASRIFDAFYSSKPSGTGIGLSICSTIMRAHEGRIWHEPNEGGGSRFLISIPAIARGEN